MLTIRILGWILLGLLLGGANPAIAHESLPASLMLDESSTGVWDVRWRVPQNQVDALELIPIFPKGCALVTPVKRSTLSGVLLSEWQMRCAPEISYGDRLTFKGLNLTDMEILVRLMDKNGRQQTHIANFRNSEVPLGEQPAQTIGISSYFKLGFMHILTGADHLLFVLCLILFMPKLGGLIKTITAFTLAHSITLVLSSLEILHIPQSPVEATIALSILFLARELVLKDKVSRFSVHRLWTVAFAFGLLHGFGFANALAEVGLPQGEVPQALVLFNLGVEAGQLAFILCTLPVIKLIRSATLWWPQSARLIHAVPVYLVGGVAGSWWLQRMMPILGVN